MQSKSLNSDSGVVFSPPSIVKDALGDSGVLMNTIDIDDEQQPNTSGMQRQSSQQQQQQAMQAAASQVVIAHSDTHHSYHHDNRNRPEPQTLTTTFYRHVHQYDNNAQTQPNQSNRTPILDTILKSKPPVQAQGNQHKLMPKPTSSLLQQQLMQHQQPQHNNHYAQRTNGGSQTTNNTFNPFADENDVPSYHFQLSKTISAAANSYPDRMQSHQMSSVVKTEPPQNGSDMCQFGGAATTSTPTSAPQPFTRTFGFNRTNLMWQSHAQHGSSGSSGSAGAADMAASQIGSQNTVSSANVSRFQLRSVSAEQLCAQSSLGNSAASQAFRPLLPLAVRSNSSSIGCSPTTFVDENSCSNGSTFIDCDAMTFKSYDLNDEYWLNFDQ